MSVIFIGDDHHRYFQEKQVETLQERLPDLEVIYWSTVGLEIFRQLDQLTAAEKPLTLVGSRHGAIVSVQWTARNHDKVKRQVLLHPSLHLNAPGLEPPNPHFIPTMVICHTKVASPGFEEISSLAGKFFHEYSVHLTPESSELTSTLSLLKFP